MAVGAIEPTGGGSTNLPWDAVQYSSTSTVRYKPQLSETRILGVTLAQLANRITVSHRGANDSRGTKRLAKAMGEGEARTAGALHRYTPERCRIRFIEFYGLSSTLTKCSGMSALRVRDESVRVSQFPSSHPLPTSLFLFFLVYWYSPDPSDMGIALQLAHITK